jgi:protein-S-isoprenylcysteine O-methyltransferase Ste14
LTRLSVITAEFIMPLDEPTNSCKLSAVDKAQAAYAPGEQLVSRKPGAIMLVTAAYGLGGGGMLAWLAFLIAGPPLEWDLGLGIAGRLIVDTLVCLFFFLQHSIMVRGRFRIWLTRHIRADFHGALYACASGICLLILTIVWQPVEPALWTPPAAIRWTLMMVVVAAGAGAWWGSRSLGEFDALGVKPAMQALAGSQPAVTTPFVVRGPYRWIRHPLYLFSLVIIWTGPVFTVDRLLHNLLWTIWIVIGATLEERDLVDCFGSAYRAYQQRVPMLIPKSVRPLMPDQGAQLHDGS